MRTPLKIVITRVWVLIALTVSIAFADEEAESNYYPYYEDRAAVVSAGLEAARRENKLLMLVLGADWCHDSRGFARTISQTDLQSIMSPRYHTVMMSVGYLDNLQSVMSQFGHPVYFGTPTVLIVEPHSRQLLNRNSLAIWQSADSQPQEEYVNYFNQFTISNADEFLLSDVPAPVLDRI
ncbi:thioredoxin family protein [Aestuariibacter salexigens]|uniref:thioredoxin family protein n=1 Tax=Aestuariibacter salexigens TaxID=226010 RepID=UPI000412C6C1|nr:thioredoxin family protein [Aestuariibacter salexigens]